MDIKNFKVKRIIESNDSIGAEYQNAYDSKIPLDKTNYRGYCEYLMSLDFLFNVPNVIQFLPVPNVNNLNVGDFIKIVEECQVAVAYSAKTRNKCVQIADEFGDEELRKLAMVNTDHAEDVPVVDLQSNPLARASSNTSVQ